MGTQCKEKQSEDRRVQTFLCKRRKHDALCASFRGDDFPEADHHIHIDEDAHENMKLHPSVAEVWLGSLPWSHVEQLEQQDKVDPKQAKTKRHYVGRGLW